jgi:hypothetical protein
VAVNRQEDEDRSQNQEQARSHNNGNAPSHGGIVAPLHCEVAEAGWTPLGSCRAAGRRVRITRCV